MPCRKPLLPVVHTGVERGRSQKWKKRIVLTDYAPGLGVCGRERPHGKGNISFLIRKVHKNETSHPIGFSSEKITLFAPPPSLFAPFFPPFSRQNPIIAHRNAKTPLLFRESPLLLLKTPKLFSDTPPLSALHIRARVHLYMKSPSFAKVFSTNTL